MGLRFFLFAWTVMLLVSISSTTVDSQVEGCSLMGIDLEHCLMPSDNVPFSVDSCCASLNVVVKAGYYCLCSLLGPSEYPLFNTRLAFSFLSCNISVPSTTHCPEPEPVILPPPAAAVAQPIQMPAPPNLPRDDEFVILPPDHLSRDDPFVHLPPGVEERPASSMDGDNTSTTDDNQSQSLPGLTVPVRWGFVQQSNGATHHALLSTSLLPVAVFAFAA